MSDSAPHIAAFYIETPPNLLAGGAPLSELGVIAEVIRRFPEASVDELTRGAAIAQECFEVDRRMGHRMDCVNNPCGCGAPGDIVIVDENHQPTGERRCESCDLAEAAKTPCIKCGGPMDGESVRAGITLCEACDPDEIGWEDDDK